MENGKKVKEKEEFSFLKWDNIFWNYSRQWMQIKIKIFYQKKK